MPSQKIVDRLNKLLKLAEQGVGGEKTTAQKMLDKMLIKHGLSISDISDESTEVIGSRLRGVLKSGYCHR